MTYSGHSFGIHFFLRWLTAWVWTFFVSSGTCYRLITLQLQASAFSFSGMCTVEAVCSCMLFKCCVFIVFLLCCSFLPTNMEFLSHSSFRPFWERWTVTIVLKHHVTVEVWLLNWSICGYDCYSSGKRSGERNFAGSMLWKPLTPHGFCGFSNGSLGNICRFIPAAELANAYKHYQKQLSQGLENA